MVRRRRTNVLRNTTTMYYLAFQLDLPRAHSFEFKSDYLKNKLINYFLFNLIITFTKQREINYRWNQKTFRPKG